MVAFKFFSETEDLLPNSIYAKLLGVTTGELLLMEQTFLSLLNHEIFVNPKDFINYQKSI